MRNQAAHFGRREQQEFIPVTREERDAEFVRRYREGETLEAIAQSHGLTRERVRQVIKKVGGPAAEAARRERARRRAAERDHADAALFAQFERLAREMASRGMTRGDVVGRLGLLYPEASAEELDRVLAESSVLFRRASAENYFSDDVLYAGVMCVLAGHLSLAPDLEWAALELSPQLLDDVSSQLSRADLEDSHRATIVGLIAAGDRQVKENPQTTITGNAYDALRDELVEAQGLQSMQGKVPWPPTKQTLAARFGGWNEALTSFGMSTASKGRPKGLIRYSASDYVSAVADFWRYSGERGTKATFARFEAWLRDCNEDGEKRPSGAAVRNYFGSWYHALSAAEGSDAGRAQHVDGRELTS